MTRLRRLPIFLFVCFAAPLLAQQAARSAGDSYELKPSPKTVAWGYYDAKTPPVLRIKSGDSVEIQTLVTASRERFESAVFGRIASNRRGVKFMIRSGITGRGITS